ncbi:putative ribonuclease H-like domain-containing protein [Tanacetum coccineum]
MLVCLFLISRGTQEVSQALADESWVEAMQEELLQFKLQDVWVLCDLPDGKRVIGTKWVFRNKRDERELIAIRLFLAFASFMGFTVYQMDVKSAFLYGNITEEVYVQETLGFRRSISYTTKVFTSVKALLAYIKPQEHELLSSFTPIEAHKSLGKDEEGEEVDVHLYRSMIGCLMYLTASRPDIMFAVCLCARFQVTPKVSHIHAVKRIFRYLKHQPKLGLWYPKDSPFHLEAFSDSDYAGDNHDRRSTSGGCQYLGRRLVYWQCKKQTIVAISSTEAEYVAAASCCAQMRIEEASSMKTKLGEDEKCISSPSSTVED